MISCVSPQKLATGNLNPSGERHVQFYLINDWCQMQQESIFAGKLPLS
jgi:hypothetical protein